MHSDLLHSLNCSHTSIECKILLLHSSAFEQPLTTRKINHQASAATLQATPSDRNMLNSDHPRAKANRPSSIQGLLQYSQKQGTLVCSLLPDGQLTIVQQRLQRRIFGTATKPLCLCASMVIPEDLKYWYACGSRQGQACRDSLHANVKEQRCGAGMCRLSRKQRRCCGERDAVECEHKQ